MKSHKNQPGFITIGDAPQAPPPPTSGTLFPLLGTVRIGTFNYAVKQHPQADLDRKAMGLMDAVLLGWVATAYI